MKAIGSAVVLLLISAACVNASAAAAQLREDPPATVADLAAKAPKNISILINAVSRAGLQNYIADPNFEATIFAPTNRAFQAALLKLKLSLDALYRDKVKLTNILSYHVVPGQAKFLKDLQDNEKLKTYQGDELIAHVNKQTGTHIQFAQGDANIVASDVQGGKGVIHVVDQVLIPADKPSES